MPRKETDLEQSVRKVENSGAQSGHSRTMLPPSTSSFAQTARKRVNGGFIQRSSAVSHPCDKASKSAVQNRGHSALRLDAKASRSGTGQPSAASAR